MLGKFLKKAPSSLDALALIIFIIVITINPYYSNDRINVFELGLYLPGIDGIRHGLVPYRDFFHLRGPLELYVPAWLMNCLGVHLKVLTNYFFFGNVLCLVFVVLIAREIVRSRYILYMMVPVIIARTYPRVTYMIWGGMRYAFGLMAMFCFIKFIKGKKYSWIAAAGLMSACAGLTSIEIGACAVLAIIGAMVIASMTRVLSREEALKSITYFVGFTFLGALPWIVYSASQHALMPYLDTAWSVVTKMQVVNDPHLVSVYPHNFQEALAAMVNPASSNFKHMTPAYAYIALAAYLFYQARRGQWGMPEIVLVSMGIYGFMMYNTAFRALLGSQFEMALMPEKIIYFFLVEGAVLWLWHKGSQLHMLQQRVVYVLVSVLFISSVCYAFARFNNRFWAVQFATAFLTGKNTDQLKFKDKNEHYAMLNIERAKGIWVPLDQHKELTQVEDFLNQNTGKDDICVMFPERGIYNFLFDRPFLGRFPMTTFTWFNDRWFDEFIAQFNDGTQAKYLIVQQKMPDDWFTVYQGYAPNQVKYDQMLSVIQNKYALVMTTEASFIYKRKY